MRDRAWLEKDDEALERLLVERWLYRGALLAIMFVSAITSIYFGTHGVTSFADRVSVGALLTLAMVAGVVAFVMRLGDLRIRKELHRRRSPPARS